MIIPPMNLGKTTLDEWEQKTRKLLHDWLNSRRGNMTDPLRESLTGGTTLGRFWENVYNLVVELDDARLRAENETNHVRSSLSDCRSSLQESRKRTRDLRDGMSGRRDVALVEASTAVRAVWAAGRWGTTQDKAFQAALDAIYNLRNPLFTGDETDEDVPLARVPSMELES